MATCRFAATDLPVAAVFAKGNSPSCSSKSRVSTVAVVASRRSSSCDSYSQSEFFAKCDLSAAVHARIASVSAQPLAPSRKVKFAPTPDSSESTLVIRANKRVQKRRTIVLTKDVTDLGKTGELVSVKTGYFRNFLYPTGKAKIATADLLKSIKQEEERVESEKRKVKEEAESIARQFQAAGYFNVRRRGGQGKQIFGSVTSQDVVDIIKAQTGREVDKRVVTVPEIRETGQYTVEIKLHPEVIAPLKINVIAK